MEKGTTLTRFATEQHRRHPDVEEAAAYLQGRR
jgi:hypothetical protein